MVVPMPKTGTAQRGRQVASALAGSIRGNPRFTALIESARESGRAPLPRLVLAPFCPPAIGSVGQRLRWGVVGLSRYGRTGCSDRGHIHVSRIEARRPEERWIKDHGRLIQL